VLHDAELAEAILDRYVRRGRSYRTRHQKPEAEIEIDTDAAWLTPPTGQK
jgi:hypothetical protein